MRQVVLDTETTGLEPKEGHRIIEIGCVELVDRKLTGRHFHEYIQPDREIDAGAAAVHGITTEFLQDKPRFIEILPAFIDYIKGAELIIHNAPFDIGFLDHEFALAGSKWGKVAKYCTVLDTLTLARSKHPGQKNSLDALCKRYDIDNSHRDLHGALLDTELLADVYLRMTGGQAALSFDMAPEASKSETATENSLTHSKVQRDFTLKVVDANAEELSAHEEMLALIAKKSGAEVSW